MNGCKVLGVIVKNGCCVALPVPRALGKFATGTIGSYVTGLTARIKSNIATYSSSEILKNPLNTPQRFISDNGLDWPSSYCLTQSLSIVELLR